MTVITLAQCEDWTCGKIYDEPEVEYREFCACGNTVRIYEVDLEQEF